MDIDVDDMDVDMDIDVVVVGSGPVGTAYARTLLDSDPHVRVLVVEAGPAVTDPPGRHLADLADPDVRVAAERACQGPDRDVVSARAASGIAHNADPAVRARSLLRRPGLFRPTTDTAVPDDLQQGMPGALVAADVGGMGIHWLGACPRPAPAESPDMVDGDVLDAALTRAEALLGVRTDQFADSTFARHLERTLGSAGTAARAMPLAVSREPAGGVRRHGTADLLGPLAHEPRFTLRSDTVCLRVLREGDRTVGVLARDRVRDVEFTVAAGAVVLACDALRTPQLLHASGIRPAALGRHLNEHAQVSLVAEVEHGGRIDPADVVGAPLGRDSARPSGITWLPYDPVVHPWHGMLARIDPASFGDGSWPGSALVAVHLYLPQPLRWDNRVEFSDTELDWSGLPAMSLRHTTGPVDAARLAAAASRAEQIADVLGRSAPGERPLVLPSGSSLHYQGTVRMGARDDGTAVCDPYGEVWAAPGVFVAGTGVIPGETAGNPTLLAVALAVVGAERLAARLDRSRSEVPTA